MKKTLISIGKYLIFLSIGFFLLFLVFREIKLETFVQELKGGHYLWMLVALLCAVISHFFRALRWNLLINSLNYKTNSITTFYAVMVGYLANTAVPRLGEVSRCGVLTKREKIPFSPLFGTVISERIFDLFVLIFLIFLDIIFQLDRVGGFLNGLIWEPLVAGLSGKVWVLGIIGFVMLIAFLGCIYFIKKNRDYLAQYKLYLKLEGFALELFNGIKTIKHVPQKSLFIAYTVMVWFMYLLMIYFPFMVFDATSHLGMAEALTVLVIGSLGIVAPVPGGLGTYHIIVKALLVSVYSISASAAVTFAAISHLGQTLMNVVVGGISYFLIILGKRPALNNYEETDRIAKQNTHLGPVEVSNAKVGS